MNEMVAERPDMAAWTLPVQQTARKARLALPFLAMCAGFFMVSAETAHADFRVCNATQNLVGVAIGYRVKTGWTTEGWWHIDPSNCKTLIEGPLSSRFYYLYAEDAQRGGRWEGPINMCVADKEFKIAGINDCFARGFQRSGFQEYDTGEQTSWMVQLTDEAGQTGQTGAGTQTGASGQPVAPPPPSAAPNGDATPPAGTTPPAQPAQNP